ncbi:twin-arginine translocase TatA/TatE family subunit [Pengzhenrongella frigida]|uniref:Sec-independent protein translocase TatB n=1 Tax=Pengzhenrongella frigida TaxID=1259133 RepID=A0A4Q5N6R0_9MICO|nr:twin-arginine translocase TatA/TatE family subunit [Cellulomonas sp. HLT2-17]RYV52001.1 Sec-independent protein translocase TatB [Cellulomonas sp. HLT2-17]
MFDINGSEFLLLILVAIVIVGPERLPRYAAQLGAWVRTLRGFLRSAKTRVDEELGEQAGDVDWTALDPRRYDPRRIVREALLDDPPPPAVNPAARTYTSRVRPAATGAAATGAATGVAATGAGDAAVAGAAAGSAADGPAVGAPFDDEAT